MSMPRPMPRLEAEHCPHANVVSVGEYAEHYAKAINSKEIVYCPSCRTIRSRPIMFLDLQRSETPEEVARLQADGLEQRRLLIERAKALRAEDGA